MRRLKPGGVAGMPSVLQAASGSFRVLGPPRVSSGSLLSSPFGGSVGGAIPRERVRRLAAGRRSVRRRVLVKARL